MRKFSICFLFLMNAYISFSFRNAGIEAFRMILDNVLREEKQAETDATSKVCTYDRNVYFILFNSLFYNLNAYPHDFLSSYFHYLVYYFMFLFCCPQFRFQIFINSSVLMLNLDFSNKLPTSTIMTN